MTSDANDPSGQPQNPPEASPSASPDVEPSDEQSLPRRKILVGSQRDPDAYKPKPKRDWVSANREKGKAKQTEPKTPRKEQEEQPKEQSVAVAPQPVELGQPQTSEVSKTSEVFEIMTTLPAVSIESMPEQDAAAAVAALSPALPEMAEAESAVVEIESAVVESALGEATLVAPASLTAPGKKLPRPNIRGQLPPDLEQEYQAAFADVPLDTLMSGSETVSVQPALEPESRHPARVVTVGREDVFLEVGSREQAVIPLQVFTEPPQPGATLEVVIVRYSHEDGLYEATLPLAIAQIGDWSQVADGMLVEARVTGHNTGGLECEVNRLRGFIPASQISLYRVENLEEFVDQKFTCLVTEADSQRRNLVLSRRAVLEREREEARRTMLESLAPGQVCEGVVRKVLDFGAFVDLGSGVDGLIHVSQLGWGRVKHPSEVVQEGQKIRVRVEKVDATAKKISLSYKDLLENPWNEADRKYVANTVVHGKVVKLMEYGAFVELEPGVEGMVHISELSHKRVARVRDVIQEGDEIDAVVLSVDPKAQRIGLSMKNVNPPPEPEAPSPPSAAQEPAAKPKPAKQPTKPLLGGLGRPPKGAKFGLKW